MSLDSYFHNVWKLRGVRYAYKTSSDQQLPVQKCNKLSRQFKLWRLIKNDKIREIQIIKEYNERYTKEWKHVCWQLGVDPSEVDIILKFNTIENPDDVLLYIIADKKPDGIIMTLLKIYWKNGGYIYSLFLIIALFPEVLAIPIAIIYFPIALVSALKV